MVLPIETTTIGAFPKPDYVPIRDWFDLARQTGGMNTPETTRRYSEDVRKNRDAHEGKFLKAIKQIIEIQLRSGISIPTDGEKISVSVPEGSNL